MFGRRMLVRRMRYYKRRNLQGLRKLLIAVSCIAVVLLMMAYTASQAVPLLEQEYKTRLLQAVYTALEDNTVSKEMGLDRYGGLVRISQDDAGHIQRVDVDKVEANKVCEALGCQIGQNLTATAAGGNKLRFRLGMLLGGSAFAGVGPDITVRAGVADRVEVELQPVLKAEEENNTTIILILQVRTHVRFHIPFSVKRQVVEVRVPLTESLLTAVNTKE